MKNREALISTWTDKLYNSGLNEYQAKKNAIIISDEIEEVYSQLSGSKSNDVGDTEMFYQRNIQNPYPSDSQSYTAFKKGFELGWQSKQQPINHITIEKIIRMVKNSDAEIKKLVMDELGFEQKEPVSDAIEFAEWLSGEGYQQYDCNERWIAPHNNNNVYLTIELYEQFKSRKIKQL